MTSPSTLWWGWILAGAGLFFLLVFGATWFRRRRTRRPIHYPAMRNVDRLTFWLRVAIVVLAGWRAVSYTLSSPDWAGVLVAPAMWATMVIVGLVVVDQVVLGLHRTADGDRPGIRIRAILPWRLFVLLAIMLGVAWYAARWATTYTALDGRSHVYSWVLDGVFGWNMWTPFPGPYYTARLPYWWGTVVGLAIVGTVVVLLRRPYLPSSRYGALDQGLRRRTVRDLWLAALGAVTATTALMGLDVAAAFGTVGPGSTQRAIAAAVAMVVGLWSLGLVFWVVSNLIVLSRVDEARPVPVRRTKRAAEPLPAEPAPVPTPGPEAEASAPPADVPDTPTTPPDVPPAPSDTPPAAPDEPPPPDGPPLPPWAPRVRRPIVTSGQALPSEVPVRRPAPKPAPAPEPPPESPSEPHPEPSTPPEPVAVPEPAPRPKRPRTMTARLPRPTAAPTPAEAPAPAEPEPAPAEPTPDAPEEDTA